MAHKSPIRSDEVRSLEAKPGNEKNNTSGDALFVQWHNLKGGGT